MLNGPAGMSHRQVRKMRAENAGQRLVAQTADVSDGTSTGLPVPHLR
jgi:hypothetical protein